jgi:hypothetical protein
LQHIVREHASEPVELMFVDDIETWCAERNGECRSNPIAMAIRDGSSGRAGILIRRRMDEGAIGRVMSRLAFCGFQVQAKRLTRPDEFVAQLALHEVAHLINHWGQDREDDCDEWAFRAMGWQ